MPSFDSERWNKRQGLWKEKKDRNIDDKDSCC